MKVNPAEKYTEKAKLLSAEELNKTIARMRSDLRDRMDRRKLSPLAATAIQLEIEAEQVREWRTKWARPPVCSGMTDNVAR